MRYVGLRMQSLWRKRDRDRDSSYTYQNGRR
jgi:hypothetical protein